LRLARSRSVAYLVGDQQGTDALAINATTLVLTRRYYDPFGNPLGSAPSAFPDGQKGFVGGIADSATGLTNLGAREYQPATGSFISPDEILVPHVPQDLNPYAYAKDDPATLSDSSGLTWVFYNGWDVPPHGWQTFPSTSGWVKWIENHIGVDVYFVEFSAHIYWQDSAEITIWRWQTPQGVDTNSYKTQAIWDTYWWVHVTYSVCLLFCYNGTQDLHYTSQQSYVRYASGSPWNGNPTPTPVPNPPPGA
jgi:RHS repeat-associated protein